MDDQNKTFRTRLVSVWMLSNAVLAIAIQNINGMPDLSDPEADEKALRAKQNFYFAVILYSTFGLSMVRFIGVSFSLMHFLPPRKRAKGRFCFSVLVLLVQEELVPMVQEELIVGSGNGSGRGSAILLNLVWTIQTPSFFLFLLQTCVYLDSLHLMTQHSFSLL